MVFEITLGAVIFIVCVIFVLAYMVASRFPVSNIPFASTIASVSETGKIAGIEVIKNQAKPSTEGIISTIAPDSTMKQYEHYSRHGLQHYPMADGVPYQSPGNNKPKSLIMSNMAPPMSGILKHQHPNSMESQLGISMNVQRGGATNQGRGNPMGQQRGGPDGQKNNGNAIQQNSSVSGQQYFKNSEPDDIDEENEAEAEGDDELFTPL